MMKQVKFKLPLRSLAIAGGLFLSATAFAQSGSVRGQVKDVYDIVLEKELMTKEKLDEALDPKNMLVSHKFIK